jgi:Uma2 family endonuclease
LVETLYSSWQPASSFLADANVGVFYGVHQSPIVPDMFLSLGVQPPIDWWAKRGRAYFTWEFGKPPEVAIEIVSNSKGGELVEKLRIYAQVHVPYYVVFDPLKQLQQDMVVVYQWRNGRYLKQRKPWLEQVQLGLTLWKGVYEGGQATWLRWCDSRGQLIPTGRERADHEQARAESEHERANHEQARAETERERAESERERAEVERERAEAERERAEAERERAEVEHERAEAERERAEVEQARVLTLEQELAAERQRMQALLAQLAAQGITEIVS